MEAPLSLVPPPSPKPERKPRGRKEGGQEQVVKAAVVKDKIDHLVSLHTASEEAATNLSDAIKDIAGKAGIHASVLKRFVAARAGENYSKALERNEQLAFLFESVGE